MAKAIELLEHEISRLGFSYERGCRFMDEVVSANRTASLDRIHSRPPGAAP